MLIVVALCKLYLKLMTIIILFRMVGPFLRFSPEYCFVIEDDVGICGYVVAAIDAQSFCKKIQEEWIPEMQEKYKNNCQVPLQTQELAQSNEEVRRTVRGASAGIRLVKQEGKNRRRFSLTVGGKKNSNVGSGIGSVFYMAIGTPMRCKYNS